MGSVIPGSSLSCGWRSGRIWAQDFLWHIYREKYSTVMSYGTSSQACFRHWNVLLRYNTMYLHILAFAGGNIIIRKYYIIIQLYLVWDFCVLAWRAELHVSQDSSHSWHQYFSANQSRAEQDIWSLVSISQDATAERSHIGETQQEYISFNNENAESLVFFPVSV